MLNLVLNSVQAIGESPGRIAVSAHPNGEHVKFSVLDDGPGFPLETLNNGIRPFVTQQKAGTGLGLAMVKRVVQDLGGELKLKNVEPHGACVTLSLPYKNG
jgi:nitrogen fixation/metabolism regulation signal transduction histidine kinase